MIVPYWYVKDYYKKDAMTYFTRIGGCKLKKCGK
jgi:hypothetical protein